MAAQKIRDYGAITWLFRVILDGEFGRSETDTIYPCEVMPTAGDVVRGKELVPPMSGDLLVLESECENWTVTLQRKSY